MDITQQQLDNGILKVTLNGSLDVKGAAEADTQLSGMVANGRKIIADLSNVDFIASTGIRVLVKIAKALGETGGKLAVINPTDTARRVMWTTGLTSIVPIADNEQAAISAVG
jgi:anti-anti-sigma factor